MASGGNATEFGDLSRQHSELYMCKSNKKVEFCWWLFPNHIDVNTIDFINIATTGNAQDFGDLTQDRWSYWFIRLSRWTRRFLTWQI